MFRFGTSGMEFRLTCLVDLFVSGNVPSKNEIPVFRFASTGMSGIRKGTSQPYYFRHTRLAPEWEQAESPIENRTYSKSEFHSDSIGLEMDKFLVVSKLQAWTPGTVKSSPTRFKVYKLLQIC